ncbi:MAG TPA: exo-alpha-sialidase, partial [Anaerolineaceae bacterium]|nr:exo-alpha-sialidase [Anaerolineaceae bacterium]
RPAEINVQELCEADSKQILTIIDPDNQEVKSSRAFPVWGPRSPLSVLLSHDEGDTWHVVADIEDAVGEYSYPAVIQSGEKQIAVAYTANRTEIRFRQFTIPDRFAGKTFLTNAG